MGYVHTLIAVAEDCSAVTAQVPARSEGKPTVAAFQYALLAGHPYKFTQEDVLFRTAWRHLEEADWEALQERHWAQFFSQPRACLRASPLPKRYGWGLHFDGDGRVALHAAESGDYRRLVETRPQGLNIVRAMRTRRA